MSFSKNEKYFGLTKNVLSPNLLQKRGATPLPASVFFLLGLNLEEGIHPKYWTLYQALLYWYPDFEKYGAYWRFPDHLGTG